MEGSTLALLEMLLVLGGVLAFAVHQIVSLREPKPGRADDRPDPEKPEG